MNTLKRFCMLIVALMVISTFSSAYATSFISLDNNKIVDISSTDKITDNTLLTKTKTLYVSVNGNNNNNGLKPDKAKRTIQNAINTAKAGDTIKVDKGVYKENLLINKNIKIIGHSQKDTIIDGKHKNSCIRVKKSVTATIKGFTMQNGCNRFGGGIYSEGKVILQSLKVTSNFARDTDSCGGGIFNGGIMTLNDSVIKGNNAISSAGISNVGNLVIKNSIITGNGATYSGGIGNHGKLTLINSQINNNNALYGGGINNFGILTIRNSKITSNQAWRYGGIYNFKRAYKDRYTIIEYNTPDNVKGKKIKPIN